MNVYYNNYKYDEGVGLILIAAHSLQEALETFNADKKHNYKTIFNNTNWKELEDMYYDGNDDIPCVIIETSMY